MKIDILSDLHIDFWVEYNDKHFFDTLEKYLDDSPDVEVLVVAGDLGHNNRQAIEILKKISKVFNYKKIFCVLGNHDLYVTQGLYNNNSNTREQSWYGYKDPDDVITILNGDIEEYKSIKFGGAMSWYDGNYNSNAYTTPIQEWKHIMNDSRFIKKKGDFYDIMAQELPKIKNILEADIIITHVSPLCHSIAFQDQFKSNSSSKFFCFDGEKYLEQTKAKYWIYGHSHGHHEYNVHGIKCIMNALGYPLEFAGARKTQIEIK